MNVNENVNYDWKEGHVTIFDWITMNTVVSAKTSNA